MTKTPGTREGQRDRANIDLKVTWNALRECLCESSMEFFHKHVIGILVMEMLIGNGSNFRDKRWP
ncbi:MAG TPA: hypothetical protein VIX91_09240 [Candidatus Acidoferrum sp.]